MKTKPKAIKTITISKKMTVNSFGGKKNFMFNVYAKSYLDTNNAGDVFYTEKERNLFQKWEFVLTTNTGAYNLKNLQTGLFLSSDSSGNLLATTNNLTSYQMWNIYSASEKELYVMVNKANECVLDCNIRNELFLNVLDEKNLEDAKKNILFQIMPNSLKRK